MIEQIDNECAQIFMRTHWFRCEICGEEFFGDPTKAITCQKCECNGNTDPNSANGKCDTVTGECQRCIFHTMGWNCERCSAGFWGDALAEPKGDCKSCNCYAPGSIRPSADYDALECRQSDGQCNCHSNVVGKRCDLCEVFHWDYFISEFDELGTPLVNFIRSLTELFDSKSCLGRHQFKLLLILPQKRIFKTKIFKTINR